MECEEKPFLGLSAPPAQGDFRVVQPSVSLYLLFLPSRRGARADASSGQNQQQGRDKAPGLAIPAPHALPQGGAGSLSSQPETKPGCPRPCTENARLVVRESL